ncbi:MAG: hypothetical protein QXF14_04025 [Candidatus Woesearchaeota archaeon]
MKRGQGLSINTIILAVLGLVVLVLLILIVRTQLQKGSQKYVNITGEAEKEARAKDVCETIFALRSRQCAEPGKCPANYQPLSGSWQDCQAPKSVCCEAT